MAADSDDTEVQGLARWYTPETPVGYGSRWVAWWIEMKTPIPEHAREKVVAALVNNGIGTQAALAQLSGSMSGVQYQRLVDCGLNRGVISALLMPLHDIFVAMH